ncbi:MAG: FkbM family methyltransferase [Candidatus Scalindua sediminis]|nr:FkbM family methyltransferase [Candidatus Scalindua sediminis]
MQEQNGASTMKYTSQDVESLIDEMQASVTQANRDNAEGVAIYGAGFVGTWAAQYLKSIGATITHFIDRDPKKEGSSINGIKVVLPTDPAVSANKTTYIAARHAVKAVKKAMAGNNFNLISFEGYYVAMNYERFAVVRDNYLEDSKSVETYNALLLAMLTGSLESCRAVMVKDMYFALPEFSGTFDEIYLDAGAFVGDTVEQFIWRNMGTFRHLYAFEPGAKQFAAIQHRMERLSREWALSNDSISIVKAGLGAVNSRMNFTYVDDSPLRHGLTTEDQENVGKDSSSIEVHSMDSFLQGKPVTFIKADVEGMEMDLLRGARKTILKHKPKMALCAYHYPSDLFEIAEHVRELVPEYKFSLRQHVPIFGDFVLYCYCSDET